MRESSDSRDAASSSTALPPHQCCEGSCIATEAVSTHHVPQLVAKVDAQDQHHHDLEKQHTRGTIARHHEGDHTAAVILAHPDGHDGNSARSSLNTDRDPEKGGSDTSPPTPHGITSSPAQSTRALTIIEDENFYPEGGLEAWLVVFGCWCSLLAALGVMNTLASFQANIHRNQLKDYTEGQIGWIFSVYAALSFGLGVFVGPIFDKFGARALMITGSVGVVVGMMLMSVCTGKFTFSFIPSFPHAYYIMHVLLLHFILVNLGIEIHISVRNSTSRFRLHGLGPATTSRHPLAPVHTRTSLLE